MAESNRATSAPAVRKLMASPPSKVATSCISSRVAGGVDEETFIRAFEDVPKLVIYSAKEMEKHLTSMSLILQDPKNDWEKRVGTLKKVRSLLIAGAANYDELWQHNHSLETAFQTSVKDLRSQVVREACVSISFMSQQLGNRLDNFAEALLNPLIQLIQNSAKVMATAGTVCIRFIIAHIHSARLIPILTNHLSSKSKDIRRAMCEFLDQLLHTWPTHILETNVTFIQSAVRNGIKDADPDARAFSRKAYWGFASHFPAQADELIHSLDLSYQKLLNGEASASSSSHSLESAVFLQLPTNANSGPASLPVHPSLKAGSSEYLSRLPEIPPRKIAMPAVITLGGDAPPFRKQDPSDVDSSTPIQSDNMRKPSPMPSLKSKNSLMATSPVGMYIRSMPEPILIENVHFVQKKMTNVSVVENTEALPKVATEDIIAQKTTSTDYKLVLPSVLHEAAPTFIAESPMTTSPRRTPGTRGKIGELLRRGVRPTVMKHMGRIQISKDSVHSSKTLQSSMSVRVDAETNLMEVSVLEIDGSANTLSPRNPAFNRK